MVSFLNYTYKVLSALRYFTIPRSPQSCGVEARLFMLVHVQFCLGYQSKQRRLTFEEQSPLDDYCVTGFPKVRDWLHLFLTVNVRVLWFSQLIWIFEYLAFLCFWTAHNFSFSHHFEIALKMLFCVFCFMSCINVLYSFRSFLFASPLFLFFSPWH